MSVYDETIRHRKQVDQLYRDVLVNENAHDMCVFLAQKLGVATDMEFYGMNPEDLADRIVTNGWALDFFHEYLDGKVPSLEVV